MTRRPDDPEVIRCNGWFWNPFDLEWQARLSENRWLIAKGYDLDNPPRYSPWQLA
jgi:hypothetical protein